MTVWDALQSDFADLPDAATLTRVLVRLTVAAVLGGILGYERERSGKVAGLRTHMLVSLGSALFIVIPLEAGVSKADLSRVLQGLVAGIGFLGAGAIVRGGGDDSHIHGLTTAGGVWLTAGIGVAAGMGRLATAMLITVLALAILAFVPHPAAYESKDKK